VVKLSTKALIFDFDGTLADSMLLVLPVYNALAPGLGLPPIAMAEIPRLRRLGPMKALEAYGVPLWKVPVLLHQVRRETEKQGTVPALFPGLASVFRSPAVSAVRRLILSSNSRSNIECFLSHHSIGTFERIDSGASMFGKARRLRRLLKVCHLVPAEVVYVGDELRDIDAAREVGALSVAVSWGYAEREVLAAHGPNYLVDEPQQLVQLFSDLVGAW
jgi:phosphoglycolate phosphatase-like HAD superfamily hydrolase